MSFFDFPIYTIPESELKIQVIEQVKVTVLVDPDEYSTTEETLLHKIAASVQLSSEDLNLFKVASGQNIRVENKDQIKHLIIAFGIKPDQCQLHVDKRAYSFITIGPSTYLFCASLTDLASDNDGKRALWTALKQYFNK